MMKIQLERYIFTVKARPVAGLGVDLRWPGKGRFHVFRDGKKIGVTCDNCFWSQEGGGHFEVFREVEEPE